MKLFALKSSAMFGASVAHELNIPLGLHEERDFEDGEHKCRPLENVRNEDVYVIASLYGDPVLSVNDKLCRLLFFVAALKDASARRVTAVVPYLCYARKDRKTKSRDPVTTKYVAALFEAAGTDHIVTLDVHNLQAYQNAFRIPSEMLEARKLFADFLACSMDGEGIVLISPDTGGIKRAEQLQASLAKRWERPVGLAFMEKYRSGGELRGETIVGEVHGRHVIIVDDLVSTGGTLARCAEACCEAGAKKVWAIASHGVFTGHPERTLGITSIQQLVVTNTIPPFRLQNTLVKGKVTVLDTAPLFAAAIRQLHKGGSVTALLED